MCSGIVKLFTSLWWPFKMVRLTLLQRALTIGQAGTTVTAIVAYFNINKRTMHYLGRKCANSGDVKHLPRRVRPKVTYKDRTHTLCQHPLFNANGQYICYWTIPSDEADSQSSMLVFGFQSHSHPHSFIDQHKHVETHFMQHDHKWWQSIFNAIEKIHICSMLYSLPSILII